MNYRSQTFAVRVSLLILVGCTLHSTPLAQAGTGQKTTLPAPGAAAKHGIRLAVDARWVEGRGYRPIRVTVTPTVASQADRTVSVSLRSNSWTTRPFGMSVQQDIELPAGATSAQATIAIPTYEPSYQISMDVLVDGVIAKELCGQLPALNQSNGWNSPNPRILVIGSGSEGLKEFAQVVDAFLAYSDLNYLSNLQLPPAARTSPTPKPSPSIYMSETSTLIAAADLPQRWIDYSSLDIVYVSHRELSGLKKQHPQSLRAILDWVAAGGNLWISGVGSEYEHLPEVEQACSLRSREAAGEDHPGWHEGGKESLPKWPTNNALSPEYGYQSQQYGYAVPSAAVRSDEILKPESTAEPTINVVSARAPAHLWRDYSLGRIVALSLDQLPSDHGAVQTIKLMDFRRHQWTHRHGVSPSHENRDFWNFLIPGVGLAPVGAFRVLITLFVVVIGPINFFFLRRWKRRNLLILTVPISAAVVTAALFAYALLTDGLGTRERVRSYIELDQRSGELVAWARHSYYAGLTPSAGLEFPDDTVVLPLLVAEQRHYGRHRDQDSRDLQWHDGQHLTDGWLKSRTPTQYLTVRRAKTSTELKISQTGGAMKVANRLGGRIVKLILIDEDGTYHAASNIGPDESVTLKPISKQNASETVRTQMEANFPRIPELMQYRRYNGLFNLSNNYYAPTPIVGNGANFDGPVQSTNRLEQTLSAIQIAGGPRSNRSYLAFMQHSPEVPLGLKSVTEEASFHIIEARW